MLHVRLHVITEDPPVIDGCIGFIKGDVGPAVESLRGSLGLTVLVRPGVAVLESFWATHETLLLNEEPTAPLRAELAQRAGGRMTDERYRVPVFEREEQLRAGQAARMARMEVKPSSLTDVIEAYGDTAVPALAERPGFGGALLFADHDLGHLVSETVWADPRARAASPSAADVIRAEILDAAGYVVRAVEDYDVVFSTARKV